MAFGGILLCLRGTSRYRASNRRPARSNTGSEGAAYSGCPNGALLHPSGRRAGISVKSGSYAMDTGSSHAASCVGSRGWMTETRLIVAPEGLSRFYLHDPESGHGKEVPVGATWMTREDRENEITDYVGFLDGVLDEVIDEVSEESGGEIAPLTVLGFSQGAHTVCRWVAAGEAAVARLILWGAYLPHDFDLDRGPDRLGSTELILVRGLLDHFISEEAHATQEARLEELGILFRTITHAGGHELDPALLREIAGVAD